MQMVYCPKCHESYSDNRFIDGRCPNCGTLHPDIIYKPQKKICGICHNEIKSCDRFCRYCGAEKGTEVIPYFNPAHNAMPTLYGPPMPRMESIECAFSAIFSKRPKIVCNNCGNNWRGEYERYCPKCGSEDIENNLKFNEDLF